MPDAPLETLSITATQDYPYADRKIRTGQTFDAPVHDANLLIMTGLATLAAAHEPTKRTKTRELKPQEPSAEPGQKREYRRRDLQPEE